jgi:hypothetical protein
MNVNETINKTGGLKQNNHGWSWKKHKGLRITVLQIVIKRFTSESNGKLLMYNV